MSDVESRHVRQCRREAAVVVGLWSISLVWTLIVMLG